MNQLFPSNLFRPTNGCFNGLPINYLLQAINCRVRICPTVSSPLLPRLTVRGQGVRRLNSAFNAVRGCHVLVRRDDPVVNFVRVKQLINGRSSNRLLTNALRLSRFTNNEIFQGVVSSRANASMFGRSVRVSVFRKLMCLRKRVTQARGRSRAHGPLGVDMVKCRRSGPSPFICRPRVNFLVLMNRPFTGFFLQRTRRFRVFRRVITGVVGRLTFSNLRFYYQLFQGEILRINACRLPPMASRVVRPRVSGVKRHVRCQGQGGDRGPRSCVNRRVRRFQFRICYIVIPFDTMPSSLGSPGEAFAALLSGTTSLSASAQV